MISILTNSGFLKKSTNINQSFSHQKTYGTFMVNFCDSLTDINMNARLQITIVVIIKIMAQRETADPHM